MKKQEIISIFAAVVVFALAAGFSALMVKNWPLFWKIAASSLIIVLVYVYSKKFIAYQLDADVEHSVWRFSRYGWQANQYLKPAWALGLLLPLIFSVATRGIVKFGAILTYETNALKYRSARRFGAYSFTEVTEFHNALIGAAGILGLYVLAVLFYIPGWEYLSKLAIFYGASNMIPISNLDGTQIFFGSRTLYVSMLIITVLMLLYALVLPSAI